MFVILENYSKILKQNQLQMRSSAPEQNSDILLKPTLHNCMSFPNNLHLSQPSSLLRIATNLQFRLLQKVQKLEQQRMVGLESEVLSDSVHTKTHYTRTSYIPNHKPPLFRLGTLRTGLRVETLSQQYKQPPHTKILSCS
jgi:hypothetical protein